MSSNGEEEEKGDHVTLTDEYRGVPLTLKGTPEQIALVKELQKMATSILPHFVKLCQAYRDFVKRRASTLVLLKGCQDAIQKYDKQGKIANTAGDSASIVGGLMILGGIFLAPETGGASIALIGAGTAITAAGGVTSVGSAVAVWQKIKHQVENANDDLKKDDESWEDFKNCVD